MSTVKTNEQPANNSLASLKKRSAHVDFRIEGVSLENKRICIALTKIYGIGNTVAMKICKDLQISPDKRPADMNEAEMTQIRDYIKNNVTVEGELKKVVISNIQRKIAINCYQGLRHKYKLPVRGQRTKTNARTRKGKSNPIANKKKVTK
jgi:small subunit ribosomal protein S13